jgi:hypothetical protein
MEANVPVRPLGFDRYNHMQKVITAKFEGKGVYAGDFFISPTCASKKLTY